MGKSTGRPSSFTQKVADAICGRLIEGQSLRKICLDDDMPHAATVCRWLADDRYSAFREQYARAREAQADTLFDECLDIADDGTNDWMADAEGGEKYNGDSVQRSKLRVDTRKWMAGKLASKKYGDKQLIGSDPDNPLPDGFRVQFVKAKPDA